MKCKNCGKDIKATDDFCPNCGEVNKKSVNDLYDDINTPDEEDENYLEDSDNEPYNKELEDLLNSYENSKKNDFVDYSDFNSLQESKDDKEEIGQEENNESIEESGIDDFTLDNFVELTDSDEITNDNTKQKKKNDFHFSLPNIPFKIMFIVAVVAFVGACGVFGYKLIAKLTPKQTTYKINKEDMNITSKYSLTKNPNYINNHTWVCGNQESDGSLTTDTSTYFQYDFNKDSTYARQFLNREDTYEDGKYSISLEDTSNDQYSYKIVVLANLDGGYKTRYTFTLVTNKEGTKATYKYNSSVFACEEMNYYNNKYR